MVFLQNCSQATQIWQWPDVLIEGCSVEGGLGRGTSILELGVS